MPHKIPKRQKKKDLLFKMRKKGVIKVVGILFSLFILISMFHLGVHFLTFGTELNYIDDKAAISGLAIGEIEIFKNIKNKYDNLSNISRYIIASEWLFIIIIIFC